MHETVADAPHRYRWTCPICGVSNDLIADPADGRRKTLRAVETHIRNSSGEGHGDQWGLDDDLDLEECIEHAGAVSV